MRLYEWNYKKQLLRIQAAPADQAWEQTHDDIFTEEFLLTRPLLSAIRRSEPTVLLVDEIDKTDVEVEALLLEVLSDFQVTIPEMGTIEATRRPFVVLTSNANRELSEALKRRCLYLYIDYPSQERERDILLERVPGLERSLAEQVVARRRDAARTGTAQVALAGRVDRLGPHPARARHRRARQHRARVDARAWCSSTSPITRGRSRNSTCPQSVNERALASESKAKRTRVSLFDRHVSFIAALRDAGLSVSVAEDLDAVAALGVIELLDREQLRAAYAAALVKRHANRPAFDTVFDLFFPATSGTEPPEPSADPERATANFRRDDPELVRFRAELQRGACRGR